MTIKPGTQAAVLVLTGRVT